MPVSRSPIWPLTILAILLLSCLTLYRRESQFAHLSSKHETEHICSFNLSSVDLHLTHPLSYGRLVIDVSTDKRLNEKHRSKDLAVSVPKLQLLSPYTGFPFAGSNAECISSAAIRVPRLATSPVDASSLVFGVSTSLSRLEESLSAFAVWAAGTGTTIFALVDGATREQALNLTDRAAERGVSLNITTRHDEEGATDGDRSFALIKHVYEQSSRHSTQWIGLIDDDTFFPSMPALKQHLDKYDATEPHYVGGLAEDLQQLQNFGVMAYGGGGIFLSMPLLRQLYSHYDECNADRVEGGDKRIAECIYRFTTTKLSWDSLMHQCDFLSDASGFYEADRPQPLSVHHWKSWNRVDVVGMSAVAAICGVDCVLQNFRLTDGWTLVNGFSIIKYSKEYAPGNMEQTWPGGGDYRWSLGPLRQKDEGKISFRLEHVVVENGQVRQIYIRRDPAGDSLIEVVWRRR